MTPHLEALEAQLTSCLGSYYDKKTAADTTNVKTATTKLINITQNTERRCVHASRKSNVRYDCIARAAVNKNLCIYIRTLHM